MNQSNSSAGLPAINTVAFGTVVFVLLFINALFIITTISVLAKSGAVNKYIKIVLNNLLMTVLFLNFNLLLPTILALVFSGTDPSSAVRTLALCRYIAWGITVGVDARLHSLAVFAVTIWLMIKCGRTSFKIAIVFVMVGIPWVIPVGLTRLYVFVPLLYGVEYHDHVLCFETNANVMSSLHTVRLILGLLGGIVNNIIPLVVSIVAAIATVCHIKRSALMEEDKSTVQGGLARLMILLVIGNSVNYAGIFIVGIVQSILKFQQLSVYFTYIFGSLYLYPTPIFVWIYLKPLQRQIRASLKRYLRQPRADRIDSAQTMSSHQSGSA